MMKSYKIAAAVALLLAGCAERGGLLPEGAVEVEENRLDDYISPTGARYDMRTYIVPFEDPYYITVRPSGRTLAFETEGKSAGSAAAAYIQRRGCTGNLSRLSSRDVYDAASNTWTIVISC